MLQNEPTIKQGRCVYCADAQVNHTLFYFGNLFSIPIDNHIVKVMSRTPSFLKDSIDWLLLFLFKMLSLLKIINFSSDINKAGSFRSLVIWKEAQKRNIKMEQITVFGKPLDYYRANIKNQTFYFQSIPIPPKFLDMRKNWDDKFLLKNEFSKNNIPIPFYTELPLFYSKNIEQVFHKLKKPIIIKPKVGSRGRHTVTNISTLDQFNEGVNIARKICPYLVAEEHLAGDVCRATLINGVLAGFYRGRTPRVVGDGKKTIRELVEEKNQKRPARVESVKIGDEIQKHISRLGFTIDNVLPKGMTLSLSHRTGRLFGGTTKEMVDELHSSFIPILERASKIVNLAVVGFDCIIPDPTIDAGAQRWGIIECNTLPFIDLHYYALEGKPRNIAGMIWDLWK